MGLIKTSATWEGARHYCKTRKMPWEDKWGENLDMGKNQWGENIPWTWNLKKIISSSRKWLLTSFWSLDRVNLLLFSFHNLFNMGCKITVPVFPLKPWIRSCSTILPGLILRHPKTAFAGFNHGFAGTPVICAAPCCHKHTLIIFSDRCTNHFINPIYFFSKIMETK